MESSFNQVICLPSSNKEEDSEPTSSVEYIYCDCSGKSCDLNVPSYVKDTINWKDCGNILNTGKKRCTSGLKLFQKCSYDVCRVCVHAK